MSGAISYYWLINSSYSLFGSIDLSLGIPFESGNNNKIFDLNFYLFKFGLNTKYVDINIPLGFDPEFISIDFHEIIKSFNEWLEENFNF